MELQLKLRQGGSIFSDWSINDRVSIIIIKVNPYGNKEIRGWTGSFGDVIAFMFPIGGSVRS